MTEEHIVTDNYAGKERRRYVKTLEQLEQDIMNMFVLHEAREKQWVDEVKVELLRAFPNGDVIGHCEYHDSKIKAAQAEAEFWKVAKEEAIKKGVSGLVAVLKTVMLLSLLGLAYKVGIGPAVAKMLGVS